ncbi:hypothetical protein RKE38_06980 [Phycicoccus sp. M110.8]|uniref:hypothetical protein n=1 Tax=Phycicoccus sp. M110.8 TaxID=3075433 RepID=UPI0028FD5B8D|nr:hypothetical protein [Phycicoccus sp. M110.8]MDU0313424.1 hypothetical protein [Phycicoccus sp. M110.8]
MSVRGNRLAVVLRVRRIQEELRQADLARALATAAAAEQETRAAHERYLASAGAPDPGAAAAFRAARERAGGRARHVAQAGARYELALGDTERARVLLTEARTRTSGLERLVDRAREVAHRELLAADQREADESASRDGGAWL